MNGLSLKEYEKFSAYLDGELPAAEARQLEEQIKAHPEWRLAIEELSATRDLLRRAPRYRAPRNFTISPEVARQYARKGWLPSFISFRLSAAVAALAMVAALVLQILPGAGLASRVAMAPAAAPQAELQAMPTSSAVEKTMDTQAAGQPQASAPAESAGEATPPPVILWGDNSGVISNMGVARGMGGGGGGCEPGQPGCDVPGGGIVTYNNEKVGSPMQGGAADTIAPAPSGGGIVTYNGVPPDRNVVGEGSYIPPMTLPAGSAAGPSSSPESQPTATPEAARSAAEAESANPILGFARGDQAGQIIAQAPITQAPTAAAVEVAPSAGVREVHAAAQPFWSPTRIAQVGLVGLALLALVAALLLRRRG